MGLPLCRSDSAAKAAQTEASLLGVAKRSFLVIRSMQPSRNCGAHEGLFRRYPTAPAEDLAGTVTGILRGSARQPILFEDSGMPQLCRRGIVVTNHRGAAARGFFRPPWGRVLNLKYEYRETYLKPRIDYTQNLPKPQHLSELFFRCHRPAASCGHHSGIPLEKAWNQICYFVLPIY